MDRKMLGQLRNEVARYSDAQLWTLFHLAALELEARGELEPDVLLSGPGRDTPDATNRPKPELAD
jgi:hypothetical protein